MKRWLVAALFALGSGDVALANDSLKGRWKGSLTCDADMGLQMVLSIDEVENGRLKGIFEFRSSGRLAKYNVSGTATSFGKFELEPGAWILRPSGFRASGLSGELVETGQRKSIQGTLKQCRIGSFQAFFQEPVEPPPPPLSKGMFDREGPAWINAVRGRIREFAEKRESNQAWWNMLETEVIFSRVDRPIKDQLLAEVREARANLRADTLLADLASGPQAFPLGIGRALSIFRKAQESDWPDKIKLRVYQACRKQVAEVLRPALMQAAALAPSLPTSLEGLVRARAVLAPVEEYRASLEQAFGKLDQENLLKPLSEKITALESNPSIATEFREELEKARQQADPRHATENVIFSVLGQHESSSPLTVVAKEGRRLAALAEVDVQSSAQNEDGFEPGAADIAAYMHGLVENTNAVFAGMRCAPGKYDFDPITIARCKMGELEVRLKKVVKIWCRAEKPRQQYVCQFDHRSQLVSFRTGEPVPLDYSLSLQAYFPAGRLTGSSSARFVPALLGSGWVGSRVAGDQN